MWCAHIMRRRSSASDNDDDDDEEHDTSTTHNWATTSSSGRGLNDHQRGLDQTYLDSTPPKDRRRDVDAVAAVGTPRTKQEHLTMNPIAKYTPQDSMAEGHVKRRSRLHSPWSCSLYTLATTLLGFVVLGLVLRSFTTRQLDTKGCEMSYMRPSFTHFTEFDTEHTRFASKYSLYLYREGGIDDDSRVWSASTRGS